MRNLIFIFSFLFIQTLSAQTFSVDKDTYDCNYAGKTTEQSSNLKKFGMTLEEFMKLSQAMPEGPEKELYMYYSKLGFQSSSSDNPYEIGYRLCQFNRS